MDLIKTYFPEISDDKLKVYQEFKKVFTSWNKKINCVSRKDMENFEERHILHSLAISKVISFPNESKILDVGTGGGFPGLPLAIMFPDVHFHLIDGIGKKIKVVQGVIDELQLKNVEASKARSEEIKGKYDFITARAVARAITFHRWVSHLKNNKSTFENHGIYYLKGGDMKDEMRELKRPFKIWSISDFYKEEFFATKKIVFF